MEKTSSIDYWNQYYKKTTSDCSNHRIPTQFATFCANEIIGLEIAHVIEIGAGDGRDSLFFAALGFNVTALDFSSSAIKIIESRAAQIKNLKAVLIDATRTNIPRHEEGDGNYVYYSRFFLHTLRQEVVPKFFKIVSAAMSHNDYFFAEYRNKNDQFLSKHTPSHDRFFHNASYVKEIAMQNNLKCFYEVEGRGMAKWQTDDAIVTRQIFVKDGK